MSDAIRVFVRYDVTDEKGETRRERNERFGFDTPPLIVPEAGIHFWKWYFEISSRLMRVRDGIAIPISWADINGWVALTGNIIRPLELQVLFTIDDAFCETMNAELKAKQEAASGNGKGGKDGGK